MRTYLGGLILAGALAGCGSIGGEDAIPLGEAPARLGEAMCLRLTDCSALGAVLLAQTTCDSVAWQFANDTMARLDDWVGGGTVRYDEAAMVDCLADVRNLACAELDFGSPQRIGRCGDAIHGLVTVGGACEDSLECAPDTFCDRSMACPGTCQPLVPGSGACTVDDACPFGYDCAGGFCLALGHDGAACGGTGLPQCALGFQCDTTSGTPGVCRPLTFAAGPGAACNPSTGVLCGDGLACAHVVLSPSTFRCEPTVGAGAACWSAVPNLCPAGQVCVLPSGMAQGQCQAQGTAGQACLTGGGVLFGCAPGLTCDSASDLCVNQVDNGQSCTTEAQCAHACEGGVCAHPGACE